MNLIEIKILYNADYPVLDALNTLQHIEELMYWVGKRADVIHVSKTRIAEGGGDDDER